VEKALAEQPARPLTLEDRRFGRYELLFRLASGGMAQLFVGRLRGVEGFEKLVVIKLIHEEYAQDTTFVKMFIDEARLLGRISHPNVVQVMELGQNDGAYYIAMEYVHGESLGAVANKAHIPLPIAARLISDAAAGLHAAHELRDPDGNLLGVVHRDVSPGNILISYGGAVKVTDFGVARATDNLSVTQVGTLKGKFSYMAPEYLKAGRVDRRSDIFALGVVLYEVTTRKRLFKGTLESRRPGREEQILPPSLAYEGYPEELERIVMRALEGDPAMRFQTAQQMHNALEQYIVGCGSPTLGSDLGELMTRSFAERMQKKRGLIGQSARVISALPEMANDGGSSSTLRGQTISQAERSRAQSVKRQRNLLMVSTGLLLASAIIALAIYIMLPGPDPEPPPPSKVTAPAVPDIAVSPQAADLALPDATLMDDMALPPVKMPSIQPPTVAKPPVDRPAVVVQVKKPPTVAVKKPVVAVKKPVVAVKKPAVAVKKPAVAVKKPVVKKPVKKPVTVTKPVKTKKPGKPPDDLFGNPFQH